jgi:FHA domain-containing protein
MAGPLAALERFFERLFERPAARIFRTQLQPVQLQRRLERMMEAERRHGADRTYVPNRYRLHLNPQDVAAFSGYQQTLEAELSESVLSRARSRGYTVVDRPRVTIHADDVVTPGEVQVEAELIDPLRLRPAPAGFRRVETDDEASEGSEGSEGPAPADAPARRPEQTAVLEIPRPRDRRVSLVIQTPGEGPERVRIDGAQTRIGRASDNDIVLADERVSRHHGVLASRQGTLIYTDLDSTNGSYVGGVSVTEIALGQGDQLQLGDSTLTVQLES